MMPSLHAAIALVPIAMYLMMIGFLKLRTRPLMTTGWRDTLAIGIAVSGMMAVGPMELFFPTEAAAVWHHWVWAALAALYLLTLTLILLSCRPRLLAYGLDRQQFQSVLLTAAKTIDPQAFWQEQVLNIPAAGMQLAEEPTGSSSIHQVVSVGSYVNFSGWLDLERAFVQQGANIRCARSYAGVPLILLGAALMILSVAPLVAAPDIAQAQLREFLSR